MVRFSLMLLIMLYAMGCGETNKKNGMDDSVSKKQNTPAQNGGSIRQGNVIRSAEDAFSFRIPDAWIKWHDENEGHPNLHLTPGQLVLVKDAEGEWDKEFSVIVNAILPFERCIAHVGSEGWGSSGLSFSDLQVRAYSLMETPAEIESDACSKGLTAASKIQGMVANCTADQAGMWRRIVTTYSRTYQDYSAKATVDIRIRRFNSKTVGFAFMYTDHTVHTTTINGILGSVKDQ